ncbi:hypothetical protein [Methylopila sp. M107]|uniref:hypothetical protein n=1 Tax=Methylopila sp. M107 TaxID=1101190 RepID=UPI00037696AD|nr:hypothetical protein [Methylopila sp. M107]
MELAFRNSLNSIFSRLDRSRRSDSDSAALHDKVERRLAIFREARETKFRPVMDAVGAYLMAKGMEHEILIFEPEPNAPPHDRESRFCFHVIRPPRRQDAREYPGMSVACDPFSNTVRFRTNRVWTGGSAGFAPTGAMAIEEVDLAVFQDQMLAFLAAAFR